MTDLESIRYPNGRFSPPAEFDPSVRARPIDQLRVLPAKAAQAIDGLTELFSREMEFPEVGPVTVDFALALYAWHGSHHIGQILSLRERSSW